MEAPSLLQLEETRMATPAALAARQALAAELSPNTQLEAVPRFALQDADAWLRHLSEHGYVVIADALDAAEVTRAHDLLWDFLDQTGFGWQRGQESTWFPPYDLFQRWGILKSHGAGQSEVAWFCRTRPSVREAFARVWGVDHLISAFDGLNIFLPWRDHDRRWRTMEGSKWLHTDQGHSKVGLRAVQGFVALTDQDTGTGGLQVVPRSHHVHQDWVTAEHPGSADNFCMLKDAPAHLRDRLNGLPQQLVTCRAGDLVLWDSRTIHCNTPAQEPPVPAEGELLRVAVYLCHIPAAQATDRDFQLRRQAYDEGLSCNHWPLFGDQGLRDFMHNANGYRTPPLGSTDDGRRELVGEPLTVEGRSASSRMRSACVIA